MLEIFRDIIRYSLNGFIIRIAGQIVGHLLVIAITWLSLLRLGRLRKFGSVTTRHITTSTTTKGQP